MSEVKIDNIKVRDKIVLKTEKGPEGSTNVGEVKVIKSHGVLADFGLKYSYIIPYKSIKEHWTPMNLDEKLNNRKLAKSKNEIKL
ncbi:hypothetical protein [Hyunsoonleella pacifica]|jgi:hypothetical protein|uniref:Uncharacterized protein n=1 Tax=Hyunsoonleella pacifica TaxID=1080224 RepID=A0A4Q9FLZ3_9FLAO|nr:hypothetical protein [Hyunsoonleella pacifica]TBN14397.1 hypothetical protein EYD46_12545 [Hyunsoonleella pacifica]GGD13405.1 hypothetical protein GCM10011368_14230 [Hyunsoonleella pacifica]